MQLYRTVKAQQRAVLHGHPLTENRSGLSVTAYDLVRLAKLFAAT